MVDYDRFAAFPAQVHAIDSTVNYMSHYRGSPHFSHLDHPSSTPTTPSPPYPQYAQPLLSNMSPQTASQSRQPTSYPSPHSYPSPSMSSYAYPAPQQQQQQQHAQQAVEPYRGSPTASHVSLPSLNLPPIRSIDPRNPTVVQSPMGAPMGSPMGSYYAAAAAAAAAAAGGQAQSLPPPQQHMGITSSPHSQPLRYPLPAPPDGRIMSGGRHKKEIKRRTKTGCLTCRKRRIKVNISFLLPGRPAAFFAPLPALFPTASPGVRRNAFCLPLASTTPIRRLCRPHYRTVASLPFFKQSGWVGLVSKRADQTRFRPKPPFLFFFSFSIFAPGTPVA